MHARAQTRLGLSLRHLHRSLALARFGRRLRLLLGRGLLLALLLLTAQFLAHCLYLRVFGSRLGRGALIGLGLGLLALGGTALLLSHLARYLGGRNAIGVQVDRAFPYLDARAIPKVNRLAHKGLDIQELVDILLGNDSERPAHTAATAGAADAMDVVHRVFRNVEVHHVAHIGDVDAAGKHVGGNQHIGVPIAE